MFQERLRQMRESAQMSQMRLASLAGLTVSTIYSLETGRQKPTLHTAQQLARALNTSLDELVGTSKAEVVTA